MRKYIHPLTKDLNPDNWKDKINLDDLSTADLINLTKDMRNMESFGKKLGGFFKEILKARCEDKDIPYESDQFVLTFTPGYREGGLDKDLIEEEMGEEWIENHRKEGTEFYTMNITEKEE